MKMKKNIFSLILGIFNIVNISYAMVYFKVLCSPYDYQGTGVTVYIDNIPYQMESDNNDILYKLAYEGTPLQYYYEITGVPQQNELLLFGKPREWDPLSTTTLYEIFGRPYTIGDSIIQTLPRLYPPLDGYDKYSLLFQEGEVPVINVKMSPQNYQELITLQTKKEIKYIIEFDLYTPYEVYHFTNTTFSLSGQGSRNQDKKPYKFDLSGDETDKANSEIFDRKEFKLRSLRFDPSYIKNKLAGDIAESLGLPIVQTTICRLYINNKSYGLYEISDLYKKKFVKRFFNPTTNTDGVVYGSLYKAVSGYACEKNVPAYLVTDEDSMIRNLYESVVQPTAGYDTHQDIYNMIQWIENLSPNASKAEIEQKFDLDMYLKYAAMEYLLCHWDGSLGNGNNYFIYIEPNNGKYHVFTYDFDITFGKYCDAQKGNLDVFVETVVEKVKTTCYPTIQYPLLYTKILNNPEIKPIFNDLVKNIVENLFNPTALQPRINYFYEFLKQDMYWDIFSYDIFETKAFKGGNEQRPTYQMIENQFTDTSSYTQSLTTFVKEWSQMVGQLYGATVFQANGEYGTVGGKLMTLGKASDDSGKAQVETQNSGASHNSFTFTLLFVINIILFWIVY